MARLLLAYVVITILGISSDTLGEKPTLMPSDSEVKIKEGDELRIQCYSKLQTPLYFSYPEHTFMSPRSTHEISSAENGTLTFLRRSAVSLDTGWYACAAEGVEIENHFKNLNHTHENIAWIYVYVLSSEPFADRYYTFPKTIIVLAGSRGIVPCRPTSPELDVKLWRNFRIVDPNEEIWFDPKIGFIVEPPTFQDFEAIFQCKVNRVEDMYVLRYSSATGRKPKINAPDEVFLKPGDKLEIECYGETNIQFIFLHKHSFRENKIPVLTSVFGISSHAVGQAKFLRPAVVLEDTGWYGCAEDGTKLIISPFYMEYTKTEIDWIYVYVESRFIPLLDREFADGYFVINTSVFVPCRPTSPKINVTLQLEAESGAVLTLPLNENVQFHPKLGFIMRELPRSDMDCFRCRIGPYETGYLMCLTEDDQYPRIDIGTHGMLLVGEDLNLHCHMYSANIVFLEWETPGLASEKQVDRSLSERFQIIDGYIPYSKIILTVKNTTENESGQYICKLRSAASEEETPVDIHIFDPRRIDNIDLIEVDVSAYAFVGRQGQGVKWRIKYDSFKTPKEIKWSTPSGSILTSWWGQYDEEKYQLWISKKKQVMLEIHNLTRNGDAGLYTIDVTWIDSYTRVDVTLEVQAPPTVSIFSDSEPYYTLPGKIFQLYCEISGSPRPNLTCSFAGNPNLLPDKGRKGRKPFSIIPLDDENIFIDKYTQIVNLNIKTEFSGRVICTACNFLDCNRSSKLIYVTDDVMGFHIIGPEEKAYMSEDIALTCVASIDEFRNLSWDKEFYKCHKDVDRCMFHIEENRTQYTIRTVLYLKNVTECHQRLYSCWGQTIKGVIKNSSYHLNLNYPEKPRFTHNNLNRSEITSLSNLDKITTKSLFCCADGVPSPNISWYQDNVRLEESPVHKFSQRNCQLDVILNLLPDKGGKYTCIAENRFGKIKDYVYFEAKDKDGQNKILLIVIISSAVVLIVLLVTWLVIEKRRRRISKRRFKEVIQHFNEGALNRFNPKLDIIDQAEVLPYDSEWEYPRNMLKLVKNVKQEEGAHFTHLLEFVAFPGSLEGEVLGSGSFGIVRKAEAKSICPGEALTTVAVKMVRATSTLHHMVALSRELKVLVHLGQHLNIVNLLGACTKKLSYGELFVIVEYCQFGSIHDYLINRRADFIDQIDPITGEISASDVCTGPINVHDNETSSMHSINEDGDIESENCCGSDSGEASVADEEVVSNASVEPGSRSKYRDDYTDVHVGPIRTKHLLSWAWQISRGMRYLGVRKVVHGDLAARNILLADNNVIKICDFGLAKALYKEDHYKKGKGDRLPLKWMAIEAISDLRFSVESDVWSFGIVLWEIFTLAESPYPGIHPKYVYQKLIEGYRMDKPKYAPQQIYRLMTKCWEVEPASRPSFATIEKTVHEFLDESVETYYMALGHQYSATNTGFVATTGKKDYLTMDPSQIEAASFSVEKETVELHNVPSNEPSSTQVQQ